MTTTDQPELDPQTDQAIDRYGVVFKPLRWRGGVRVTIYTLTRGCPTIDYERFRAVSLAAGSVEAQARCAAESAAAGRLHTVEAMAVETHPDWGLPSRIVLRCLYRTEADRLRICCSCGERPSVVEHQAPDSLPTYPAWGQCAGCLAGNAPATFAMCTSVPVRFPEVCEECRASAATVEYQQFGGGWEALLCEACAAGGSQRAADFAHYPHRPVVL